MFQRDRRHFADYVFSAVEGRSVWQLREGYKVLLILRRYEAGWNFVKADDGEADQHCIDRQCDRARPQSVSHELAVSARGLLKEAIEELEKPPETKIAGACECIFLRLARPEQKRGERRAERKRIERGDYRRDCDGERK